MVGRNLGLKIVARPTGGHRLVHLSIILEANRAKWAHVARLKALISNSIKPGALPPDPLIKRPLAFRTSDHAEKDMAFHGLYEYPSGGISQEELEEYCIQERPEIGALIFRAD